MDEPRIKLKTPLLQPFALWLGHKPTAKYRVFISLFFTLHYSCVYFHTLSTCIIADIQNENCHNLIVLSVNHTLKMLLLISVNHRYEYSVQQRVLCMGQRKYAMDNFLLKNVKCKNSGREKIFWFLSFILNDCTV